MSKKVGELTVYLSDEDGTVHRFLPGDEVPGWAGKQMGDHCFAGGDSTPEVEQPESDGPPPKAGKGSGESAWRSYADSKGVDVSGAEGRDDIIDLLDKAGVPVE